MSSIDSSAQKTSVIYNSFIVFQFSMAAGRSESFTSNRELERNLGVSEICRFHSAAAFTGSPGTPVHRDDEQPVPDQPASE